MKPNPKNFEAFIDPEGGEWIKVKTGKFKDTIWRPIEMKMETEDQLSFTSEFLTPPPSDGVLFEKVATEIIKDIIRGMMDEDSSNNSSKT